MIGAVPGAEPGDWFEDRRALASAGVHRPLQAGICGRANEGAESVVLNGGYPDDWDGCGTVVYTGAGGQNAAGRHVHDQTLNRTNMALATSARLCLPVRVVRGSHHDICDGPPSGYRYDGLYRVADYWVQPGCDGPLVWRFRLERLSAVTYEAPAVAGSVADPSLFDAPTNDESPRRVEATISRLVRDTAVTRFVKHRHGYRCQVCGRAVETPAGPYAEAAHIRPLGWPHGGPDVPENVLCLCPNHHVAFDCWAFALTEVLGLIGDESGTLRTVRGHTVAPAHVTYHRRLFEAAQESAPPARRAG